MQSGEVIFNKYLLLYNNYKKSFEHDFCILLSKNEEMFIYVNGDKICKILNTPLYNKQCTTFKKTKMSEKIPLLLKYNISVILINENYNVLAIHHPENKFHENAFSFCFFPF